MKASLSIVLADGFSAGVKVVPVIPVNGLPPSGLADDIAIRVTNVPVKKKLNVQHYPLGDAG
jgi:hypothetical protein